MPGVPWVNFNLDEDLHRKAKSQAALAGEDLYPYLIELIREGVERHDAEQERKRRSR